MKFLIFLSILYTLSQGYIINPLSYQQSIDSFEKPENYIDLSSIGRKGYYIYYEISKDEKKINILFQMPKQEKRWFGMGFNYLMHQSNMVIVEYVEQYIDVYEAYSENYSFPSPKEIQSLKRIGYYEDEINKHLLIETNYYKNDKNYISIAYGDSERMKFHGRRKGRYIVPLQNGIAVDKNDEVIVLNIVYKLHTTWLYYGWGFLADIAIVAVRYLKGSKHYITIHSMFFLVLNVFTVIIEFLLLYLNQPRIQNISYLDIYIHFILGSIFLGIIILQHVSGKYKNNIRQQKIIDFNFNKIGYILKDQIYDKQVHRTIPRLKKIHQYIGYLLYIMGKICIFTGKWSSTILKNQNKGYYEAIRDQTSQINLIQQLKNCKINLSNLQLFLMKVILLVIQILIIFFIKRIFTLMIIGWLVIEGLYKQGKIQILSHKILTFSMQTILFSKKAMSNENKLKLMSLVNRQASVHEIQQQMPDITYCIIGQKVYDLSEFIHPGGNYMLQLVNGREVQRYLNGQQHIEGFQHSRDEINKPFTHPISSILFLKEKYIGMIDYSDRSILSFSSNATIIRKQSDDSIEDLTYLKKGHKLSLHNLKREEYGTPLIHDTYSFQVIKKDKFVFYFYNNHCSVRNNMRGISWMGLHFCIYKKQDKTSKNRLYTTVLCMTRYNIKKRQEISEMLRTKKLNSEFKYQSYTNKLPFIIKKYDIYGAFSKHLHENCDQVFKIEGPLGRGLEMSNNFKGDIAIIANGTGILPFLDLLFYFLQKNAYLCAKKMGKDKAFLSMFDQTEEDFSYLEDTNIYLYGSFENLKNFYGYEIIQDILKSEEILGINNFHLTLRFRDKSDYSQLEGKFTQYQSYFDKSFIDDISANVLCDVERVYVSGSYDLTYAISESLRCTPLLSKKLFYI